MNTKKIVKTLAALGSLAFAAYVISLFAQFGSTDDRITEELRKVQRQEAAKRLVEVRRIVFKHVR